MDKRCDIGQCSDKPRVSITRTKILFHSNKKRGNYEGVCCNPGRRIVLKNGQINTISRHVQGRRRRMLQSLFATMVDMQWRWIILILAMSFFLSWLGFAVFWWLISLAHGDLEPAHLPPHQEANGWIPCVTGILGFTSSFLFSMENQHTTGFGTRMPTEECFEGIILMCIQAIFGLTLQTAVIGVVLAKMARSKQRVNTILFSQHAVICYRDGGLCLMIRIGDVQKSRIIEAKLTLQFITYSLMDDEAQAPYRVELKINVTKPHFYLMWPEIVIHRFDKDSPLYDLSYEEMLRAKFEIVAILEGTLESTDQRVQAKTSFLPSEILWGHRFDPILAYNEDLNAYDIDYKKFDSVYQVETPLCSARDLAVSKAELLNAVPRIQTASHDTMEMEKHYLSNELAESSSSV